jgi:hypothetical protein
MLKMSISSKNCLLVALEPGKTSDIVACIKSVAGLNPTGT